MHLNFCFALLAASLLTSACASQHGATPQVGSAQAAGEQAAASEQPSRFRDIALLQQFATTGRFRTGRPANFTWLPDSSAVLYTRARSDTDRTQDLYAMRVNDPAEFRLLSTDDILSGAAEQLSPEEAARRERMRLSARGIARFSLSPDGKLMLVPLSGSVFVVDVARAMQREPQNNPLRIEGAIDAKFSPDSASVAFVREGEVFVRSATDANASEKQVSTGATIASGGTISNGEAEFVAQEEMDRTEGFWWSPTSDAIVYQQNDTKGVQTFTIADAGDPANEPQAFAYPRAGKPNVAVSLWLAAVPAAGASVRPPMRIEWDMAKYPYLARVAWGEGQEKGKPAHLRVLVQNRLQREQVLLAVDVDAPTATLTLPTRVVLTERDQAWINLHTFDPQFIANTGAMWWMTETQRGFSPRLLASDGSVLASLADSALPVGGARSVLATSKNGRTLWVTAGETPTVTQTFRIDASQSSQGSWAIACEPWSSASAGQRLPADFDPPRLETFAASPDGAAGIFTMHQHASPTLVQLVTSSRASDIPSVAAQPVVPLQLQLATVSNAERSYECAIIRPSDLVIGKRYPVINFVYAGPGVTIVSADTRRYALEQWYAQQGFIIVSIDGRGTPFKGREWERAIAGNLIDIAMHDQREALALLCERFPEMDKTRIGVYGWSFGGYFSLLAPSLAPDVFKAAAAGAPVADWRDYDTHYTERYMGLPAPLDASDASAGSLEGGVNTAGYDAANALTHAAKVASPLLILHGTADDNVYFTHSLKMANALTRAGKHYEFVPLLGQTHGVADPALVQKMHEQIADFFMRHLQEKR